jgi:hypothetical protein
MDYEILMWIGIGCFATWLVYKIVAPSKGRGVGSGFLDISGDFLD